MADASTSPEEFSLNLLKEIFYRVPSIRKRMIVSPKERVFFKESIPSA
jgi:hypothetical protein